MLYYYGILLCNKQYSPHKWSIMIPDFGNTEIDCDSESHSTKNAVDFIRNSLKTHNNFFPYPSGISTVKFSVLHELRNQARDESEMISLVRINV